MYQVLLVGANIVYLTTSVVCFCLFWCCEDSVLAIVTHKEPSESAGWKTDNTLDSFTFNGSVFAAVAIVYCCVVHLQRDAFLLGVWWSVIGQPVHSLVTTCL